VTLYFDISKLVDDPRRSGIQRVERELLRHWPHEGALVPCRFDGTRLRRLAPGVVDVLCQEATAGGAAAERVALAPFLAEPGSVVPPGAALLCAELFDDPARAAYLRAEAQHVRWLVYDFLPWLHPDWFPAGPANRLMVFLQALRAAGRRGYISAATKRDAVERILRRPCTGEVLPLGADGLGLPRQSFDPARRDVLMLGTIEARKNANVAIRACQHLWAAGAEFRLVLAGAMEPDALAEQALLRSLEGERRLVRLGVASDAALREAFGRARVLLFPSEGEGYGLPPMEALYAGIPVIAAAGLPALEGVAADGQIRLAAPDEGSIAAAIGTMLADEPARSLWAGAARMTLPRWRDFARAVAAWAS